MGNRESSVGRDPVSDREHRDMLASAAVAVPIPDSPFPIPARAVRAPRIALAAGEASGDLLGAGMIERLRLRYPDASFAGIGGPQMRAAGFDAWHDCAELAVMGLSEVLRHL